jgi:hypothetical protein
MSRPDPSGPSDEPSDEQRPDDQRADDESPSAENDEGRDQLAEEPAWVRRRRIEAVFGDVLPSTTRDERDPGRSDDGESAGEKWLKAQVPPHHGGE